MKMKIIILMLFLAASIAGNIILSIEANKADRKYDGTAQAFIDLYNKTTGYEYAIICLECDVINAEVYRNFYHNVTDKTPFEQYSRNNEVKMIIDAAIESYNDK